MVNAGFGPPSVPCLDEGVGSPRQLLPILSLSISTGHARKHLEGNRYFGLGAPLSSCVDLV